MRLLSFVLVAGLLGFSLSDQVQGQTSGPQYLRITTAGGKSLKAPVKSFMGLSFGVVATLVKEGKMKRPTGPRMNPPGQMTFHLDKGVSADFLAWVQSPDSLTGDLSTMGSFQWVDPKGKTTETFSMQGVKVISFTPGDAKGTNGATLVIVADQTDADPPIHFNQGSK